MKNVYKSSLAADKFDAIIIGSGLGGLTTAVLLAKSGKKVLVLEQHYEIGGFTHTFKRKDYEWDVGVHYVGQVQHQHALLFKAFQYISDCGIRWEPMGDIYDKAIIEGRTYEFYAGREKQLSKMIEYFPEEETAIRKYYKQVQRVSTGSVMFFSEKTMPAWLSKTAGYFLRTKFDRYSSITTSDYIRTLTNNETLIAVLCAQCGNYGLPPAKSSFAIHAMIVDHFMEGGNYPVGGAAAIHESIADELQKQNGTIAINACVKQILLHGKKAIGVEMENGDRIYADTIVSNAGVSNTWNNLLPKSPYVDAMKNGFNKIKPSSGHACLYVGLNKSDEELQLPRWNYWMYESKMIDADFDRHFAQPGSPSPLTYISFPSSKDPAWPEKHPGKSTIQVICSLPYASVEKWQDEKWMKRGAEYNSLKEKIAEGLMQQLYRVVPQIKGHVQIAELSTPLSTRHFTNYSSGEIYGLEHSPARFANRHLRPRTKIKGLFMTGQDIVCVGIGSVLFSGIITAVSILNKNLLWKILRFKKK